LRSDEELMRLLYYPPRNRKLGHLDPLDTAQPDIVDSKTYWDIVENTIMTATKSSKIEENAMCRLYIYAGRRRPKNESYLMATQEVIIDVLVHDKFTSDMRIEWLVDKINELLALEHVKGLYGRLDYVQGNNRAAPIGYSLYENVYEYVTTKK
jgi:hypothetical protein